MRAEEVQASGSSSKPVGRAGPGAMHVLPWGAQSTRGERGKLCWKEEKEDMGQGRTREGAGRQEAMARCCRSVKVVPTGTGVALGLQPHRD